MQEREEVQAEPIGDDHLELTKQEIDLAKTNFDFYSRQKGS